MIDLLTLVLLGIRSAVKQDLSTSTAELVYGTTLRLPGEFFTSSSQQTVLNPAEYVTQLKTHMQTIRAKSPRLPNRKSSIDGALLTCTHVFVRCDAVRKPLQPPYDGPYPVCKEKYYIVELKGRTDSISIDRIKPAHLDDSNFISESTLDESLPRLTRSGRRVHFPKSLLSFVP